MRMKSKQVMIINPVQVSLKTLMMVNWANIWLGTQGWQVSDTSISRFPHSRLERADVEVLIPNSFVHFSVCSVDLSFAQFFRWECISHEWPDWVSNYPYLFQSNYRWTSKYFNLYLIMLIAAQLIGLCLKLVLSFWILSFLRSQRYFLKSHYERDPAHCQIGLSSYFLFHTAYPFLLMLSRRLALSPLKQGSRCMFY